MRTFKGGTIEEIVNLPVSWRRKLLAVCDYYYDLEQKEMEKAKRGN